MTDAVALKQTHQGSKNTLPCFTSIFVCTTVLASSCPPWPAVSLCCHSGKCLPSYFHALFSVSPLPLRTPGDRLRISSLLFRLLKNPEHSMTLAKPLVLKFSFIFPPDIIPLFHAFVCYNHNTQKPNSHYRGTMLIYEILNKLKLF